MLLITRIYIRFWKRRHRITVPPTLLTRADEVIE
jgi:hypothetical protein